jgi:hypothetical protein
MRANSLKKRLSKVSYNNSLKKADPFKSSRNSENNIDLKSFQQLSTRKKNDFNSTTDSFMNNIPLEKMRCLSNEDLMKEGLNYVFKLKDLPKYS